MFMLLLLAIPGLIISLYADENTSPLVPMFSLGTIVWASLVVKVWQRKSASLALEWGDLYFEVRIVRMCIYVCIHDVNEFNSNVHWQYVSTQNGWRG
jgi:hypothetical protein